MGTPIDTSADFDASLTAKKIAPPGTFESKGNQAPRKLPLKSSNGLVAEYTVLGICNRTDAVSSGYLMRVFDADTAAPAAKPEIPS